MHQPFRRMNELYAQNSNTQQIFEFIFQARTKKPAVKLAICVIPSISQFVRAKMKTRGILELTAGGALQIQRGAPGGIKGWLSG